MSLKWMCSNKGERARPRALQLISFMELGGLGACSLCPPTSIAPPTQLSLMPEGQFQNAKWAMSFPALNPEMVLPGV